MRAALDACSLTRRIGRRFFFCPSFSIHGGVSGLYDYGPTGSAVKNNLIAAWRDFFVVEDGMLEVRRARPARPGRNGRQETRKRARSPPHLSAAPAVQVSCPAVTPAPVLAASGHVQRFTDLMVRDEASGECHRADKLLAELCGARTPDAAAGLGAGELARLAADAGETAKAGFA